jgi:HlyD family secretion protein
MATGPSENARQMLHFPRGEQSGSPRKSRRFLWLLLAVVIGTAVTLGGTYLAQQSVEPPPGQVVVAFVGDLTTRTSARGQVLPQRQAELIVGNPGRVEHIFVQVGDEVKAGDALIQLETGALERAVRLAEQNLAIQEAQLAELRKGASTEDIAVADAAIDVTRAQLADLQAGARPEEIAAAEADLRAAQALVWSAAEQRTLVLTGTTEAAIAAAEAQVADALAEQKAATDLHDWTMKCYTVVDEETGKEDEDCPRLGAPEENARYQVYVADKALEAARAELDALLAGPDSEQVNIANADVATAAGRRDAVQAQLDLLKNGSSDYEIAVAEAIVAQAEANLAALAAGPSEEQLIIAEAQVEQARIALEEALANLTDATLVSPFDGVVTAVFVSVGELASGPAVEVVDFDSLEAVVNVYEEDIGAIEIGQTAILNLEAWPNEDLTGKVVSISPKANPGETVTYEVYVSLGAAQENGLPVRPGMSATAELVTSNRQDVLLVPNIAITADRETGTFYVSLREQDTLIRREVEIGSRDSTYTEIISGLAAGDELLIEEEKAAELSDFSQGPPREIRELRQ